MEFEEGQTLRAWLAERARAWPEILEAFLFAGEGLYLATLTGPGKIWLQTMPISVLAQAIKQFIPTKSSN